MSVVLEESAGVCRHLRWTIGPEDRAEYGVRYVFCDGENTVLCHSHVGPLDPEMSEVDCARLMDAFVEMVASHFDGIALLVVIVRPGTVAVSTQDRRWYVAARRACAAQSVRLLGVYLVGRRGEREVCLDDAL